MVSELWVDSSHPSNSQVLRSMGRNSKAIPIAAADSVKNPYLHCGSHPEIVERVWDQLGSALPDVGRCLLFGTPALVCPRIGVILAVSYGTQYALRIPADTLDEALIAGARTTTQWTGGGVTDIQREFGPDWIFGGFLSQELRWCRTVYEALDCPPDFPVEAQSPVKPEV